jgi:hypothetical protein
MTNRKGWSSRNIKLFDDLADIFERQQPTDLIKRLRETASKGVSVWGDLQMEAAKEIEILTAERELCANAIARSTLKE